MPKEIRTTCALDCPCACGLSVIVEDGKALRIGKAPDSEVSPCLKGVALLELVYHPERLKHPLLKDGGAWRKISWNDAFDIAASKLEKTVEQWGHNSIFYYSYNTGVVSFMRYVPERLLNALGGVTTTVGSLCEFAGYEGLRYAVGQSWSVHDPQDWPNSRFLLIWGKDPQITWPSYYKYLKEAKNKGAKMAVIDPVRTVTAENADLWIPIRPGTDMALALGLIHVIISEKLYDEPFVKNHTQGFEELVKHTQEYTPEWAGKITGIKPNLIRELSYEFATVKPASIHPGVGVQHNTWGCDTMRSIVYLAALTGNLGTPGGGINYYGGAMSRDFNIESLTLTSLGKNRTEIPLAKMSEHILAGKPTKGRLLCVAGGNIIDQAGNTGRAIQALRSLDFILVVEQFMSSTAKLGHLVLPAAHFLEFDDVVPSWGHSLLQSVNRALDPPAEVLTEFEIFTELAKRLNLGQHFIKPYLEILDEVLIPLGVRIEELRLKHAVRVQPRIPFEDSVFPTKYGKMEFYSGSMRNMGLDPLPVYRPPPEGIGSLYQEKYPLAMVTNHSYSLLNSQFVNVPKILGIRILLSKYAVRQESLSHIVDASKVIRAGRVPTVLINTRDAKERGIRNGDYVEVFNHNGRCELRAQLSDRPSEGVVVMHVGWWLDRDQKGSCNSLTSDRYTFLGYNSILKEVMVEVKPIK